MTVLEDSPLNQRFDAVGSEVFSASSRNDGEIASEGSGVDVKRVFDIAGAVAALVFFGPVMILVYAALTCSGGGAVFKHTRVGQNGRLFYCYKFRSMVNDADRVLAKYLNDNPAAREEWSRTHKLSCDPRITWSGTFLRHTSLDELPQLINVLKGDMSLVGPRPIVQAEVEKYSNKIDAYYSCRPGITGLWQVSGRNLVTYDRRVQLDAIYARKQSLWLDARILFRTVWVVLSRRGAC